MSFDHSGHGGRARLGRRGFLRWGLAGAGAAVAPGLLAGCASPAAPSDSSTLRVWDLFSGGDGVLMDEMLAAVGSGPDAFSIDRTILEWGPSYYTKLAMAAAGGRAPEVAVLHLSRLAAYAPGGLLDPFDLDLLAEFGVTEQHFAPAVWERAGWDGEIYAIPLDTHPFIVFYDKEIADRVGLLDSDGELAPFGSPEAMIEASAALAAEQGGSGVLFGHVADQAQCWRLFNGLYAQTGATWELPDGGEPRVDFDAAVRVVTFMTELFDGRTNPNSLDYFGAMAAFQGSRGAMIFCGEWELPNVRSTGRPMGAAPFPNLFGQPAVHADSHAYVLPRQERVDQARRREAHRFVATMLKNSYTWASAGHIPAYQPVIADERYADLDPQASYADAAEVAVLDPPSWFTGSGSNFQNQMTQPMSSALIGDMSPEQAVQQMVDQSAAMIDQPNPVA
ncbi:extracellular solute-binding protein [Streptomyces sp. DSM 44915]|uniref:Extracellular solute-binding protein n=1 Tax=Streptomyces chisholmiae TaxID=3075540 RepID=A0ABU2JIB3_9ACTN|nr:extracellular solute-binding protein [Streptomyces sp. DSM 44915]MDT0264730.1 extracellular solute-binding protein [Streptomyces sp. DSM 44915]